MQRCRHAPAHAVPVRRSDLREGDRAAGLALTIQIVAKESRGAGSADESDVAIGIVRSVTGHMTEALARRLARLPRLGWRSEGDDDEEMLVVSEGGAGGAA